MIAYEKHIADAASVVTAHSAKT